MASFTLDRYGHLYPEAELTLRDRLVAIWLPSGADQKCLRSQRGPNGAVAAARTCQDSWTAR